VSAFSPTRLVWVLILGFLVVDFSLFMAVAVPVHLPRLPPQDATIHLSYLGLSALAVALVLGVTVLLAWRTSWTGSGQAMLLLFGALTAVQLGHFGEHIAQVVQLVLTHGNLKQSRGLLSRFDQETVHLTWNVGVLLLTCLLALRYKHNPWLWISFGVAGFHTVEHLYLYSIYTTDLIYYQRGGINGIFGMGGIVGSSLTRPYLHFMYNAIEVSTLLIAFVDQFRSDFRPAPKPAFASA
jgi:hypothetical protein